MTEISVDRAEVEGAANNLKHVAAMVDENHPTVLTQVGEAMPGTESASAASDLATVLTDELTGWANDARTHGEQMSRAAGTISDTDAQVGHAADRQRRAL